MSAESFDRVQRCMDKAAKWYKDALEAYDPDFIDPSIASLAKVRVLLAKAIEAIDDITLDDAIDVRVARPTGVDIPKAHITIEAPRGWGSTVTPAEAHLRSPQDIVRTTLPKPVEHEG